MEFSDGDATNQGEGRAWVMQTVQGCKLASRQRGTGRCWQPRGQALTLPPHCPPGSASLWDPHLRLTAPHAPDRQEGGHGAGPRRPREGGGEQRRPLQPPLPGRDPPPPLPLPCPPGPAQGTAVALLDLPSLGARPPAPGAHSQLLLLMGLFEARDLGGGFWRVADCRIWGPRRLAGNTRLRRPPSMLNPFLARGH